MKAIKASIAPQFYASPLKNLPEGKSGSMEVKHVLHRRGEKLPVIGMRQALTRGIAPASVTLPFDLVVHSLTEKGGVWMTDLPEELQQIAELLYRFSPKGRVLVGGLGLGVLTSALLSLKQVKRVTTVEINPDVVKLCWRFADERKARLVQQDLHRFLRDESEPFDYYLLDTWQSQSEGCWWNEVMPMRRAIRRRFGARPKIWCWAEDIMWGQIETTLNAFAFWQKTAPLMGKSAPKTRGWYYDFLPAKMSNAEITHFLKDVGLPAWEKKWGRAVDRGIAEVKKGGAS